MPDTELATVEVAELAPHPGPLQVVAQATAEAEALARVIEEQHLYAVTGRDRDGTERRHVQVEGWQTLGAMRGVFALTEWSRRTPDFVPLKVETEWYTKENGGRGKRTNVVQEGVGGWEARVQLVNAAGVVVGAAEAECTWEEETWRTRESNALRSMAQTRAIGKAYRGVFAFVMALAGYNPTPAEEMTAVVPRPPDVHNVPDGYVPESWAKQVAFFLAGGNRARAAELHAEAWVAAGEAMRAEDLDPSDDVGLAERAVALMHEAVADLSTTGD